MTGRHGGNQGGRLPVHGLSKHPLYAIWRSMKDRCHLLSHHAYSGYGSRGVAVCAEWRADFMSFYNDMIGTYEAGLTLERRDNSGGYDKDNCIWVDWKTQARNRRGNRLIDTPVGEMLLCEAAEMSGLSNMMLKYRVDAGWPAARLFDPPNKGRQILPDKRRRNVQWNPQTA